MPNANSTFYLNGFNYDFEDGASRFSQLYRNLESWSSVFDDLRFHRSNEEAQKGEGLRLPDDLDLIIDFLRGHDLTAINVERYNNPGYSPTLSLSWKANAYMQFLKLMSDSRQAETMNGRWLLGFVGHVVRWHPTHLGVFGNGKYSAERYNLFPMHRIAVPWAIWVPQELTAAQIPSARLVQSIGSGTLVLSTETCPHDFTPDVVERLNAVEHELNEAGALPLLTDRMKWNSISD